MLTHFPEIGRKIPEFRNEYSDLREMIIDDYRLAYRIHSKHIGIITIFHGRRQISSAV